MIRSELMNVRSTKTTWVLLLVSVLMAAISLLANLSTIDDSELGGEAAIQLAMHSATVATLTFAIVAALVNTTSDYRFGRIDQMLLTDPSGRRFIAAKAAVAAGTGVLYAVVGGAVALVGLGSYYAWKDVPIELTSRPILEPLAGSLVGCALFAVLGVGIGTVVRNQPAAVAGTLFALLVVQPTALLGVPDFGRLLPGAMGLALTLAPDPNLLTAPAAGGILMIWTVAVLGAGMFRLRSTRAG